MFDDLKYIPIFRVRQQEIIVLQDFAFSDKIIPMLEIIKEKDRSNRIEDGITFYSQMIKDKISAPYVFVDLPVYLTERTSTQEAVMEFNRGYIHNFEKRNNYFIQLNELTGNSKIVPVISSFFDNEDKFTTLQSQYDILMPIFGKIAVRTFYKTFDNDLTFIKKINSTNVALFYDIDNLPVTSPIIKKHKIDLNSIRCFKAILGNAIPESLQNVHLIHGAIVGEADNSLLEMYSNIGKANAFGDYVGIKKDELTSGGTISPGFIMYDPLYNYYYGFKGNQKKLSEFEDTIVPDVLNHSFIKEILKVEPAYLSTQNKGYQILLNIKNKKETGVSGQNQAKFKGISMRHYLYCMSLLIQKGSL